MDALSLGWPGEGLLVLAGAPPMVSMLDRSRVGLNGSHLSSMRQSGSDTRVIPSDLEGPISQFIGGGSHFIPLQQLRLQDREPQGISAAPPPSPHY